MSLYTFHFVLLFVFVGIASAVAGGPFWAYPLAFVASLLVSVFVTAYPTDNSLRWTLGAFGSLLMFGATTRFVADGLTPISIQESACVFFFGISCVWSAAFSIREPEPSDETWN